MGLQIWLPLQGNLENKGLSKITLTTSGTPTIEDGKIGQCYTFNENSYLLSTESFLEGATKYSLCCWFKSDYEGTAWKRIMALGNHTRVHLDISPTTQKVRFFISKDGTSSVYSSVNSTTLCHDGQWHHVCGTFDNGKIKLYIDGILEGSATGDATTYTATGGQQLAIGAVTNGGGMFEGSINDVRIYDECLSPMQVKLISQGLVVHYLLNNNGSGLPNLFGGTPTIEAKTNYLAYQLPLTQNLEAEKTYTLQLWDIDISNTAKTEDQLGIGIYWGGGNIRLYRWYGASHTNYLTITFTVTTAQASDADAVKSYLNFYNSPSNVSTGTKYMSIGRWKLEESDIPTPWCPNVNDTIYNSMGYNTNIEYDVSGYCNNGTKYNITNYIPNSPRYSIGTVFDKTNYSYINCGRNWLVRDEITINIWAYMEDWTTYNYRLISCTESGGWNFEKSSDGIHFAIGTGATSNSYKNTTNYPLVNLTSGWHMFTGSYDGFQNKMYIDGVLAAQNNSPYTTKTPIYYNSSAPVLIGAEANKTQTPAGSYFDGYMSDVRIYATALSESDLQSLYNNSGFLDSSGNIYATEYTES